MAGKLKESKRSREAVGKSWQARSGSYGKLVELAALQTTIDD